jgi:hypothetical protein
MALELLERTPISVQITRDEDRQALQELIAQERASLAKLKRFIAFQRDVLRWRNRPAEWCAPENLELT